MSKFYYHKKSDMIVNLEPYRIYNIYRKDNEIYIQYGSDVCSWPTIVLKESSNKEALKVMKDLMKVFRRW